MVSIGAIGEPLSNISFVVYVHEENADDSDRMEKSFQVMK
jgi:hypothetical protein